jgi:hypothetical protein
MYQLCKACGHLNRQRVFKGERVSRICPKCGGETRQPSYEERQAAQEALRRAELYADCTRPCDCCGRNH